MTEIDYIIGLLDWRNSVSDQEKGIAMADEVENINVFIQPHNKKYNKNVWENCAQILAKKTDEELSTYLLDLLEWIQDLNWPGALCILHRLQRYADFEALNYALNISFKYADAIKDMVWMDNLQMVVKKDNI